MCNSGCAAKCFLFCAGTDGSKTDSESAGREEGNMFVKLLQHQVTNYSSKSAKQSKGDKGKRKEKELLESEASSRAGSSGGNRWDGGRSGLG